MEQLQLGNSLIFLVCHAYHMFLGVACEGDAPKIQGIKELPALGMFLYHITTKKVIMLILA